MSTEEWMFLLHCLMFVVGVAGLRFCFDLWCVMRGIKMTEGMQDAHFSIEYLHAIGNPFGKRN